MFRICVILGIRLIYLAGSATLFIYQNMLCRVLQDHHFNTHSLGEITVCSLLRLIVSECKCRGWQDLSKNTI